MEQVSNHPVANRDETSVLESSEPDPAAFQEQVYQATLLTFEYNILDLSVVTKKIMFNVCISQVSLLFAEWYRIYELPGVNDQLSARFVLQLQKNGLLKADDTSDRFFRRLLVIIFQPKCAYMDTQI